ncbi:hypothetical protein BC828DRAFT_438585 [Blastocladiella britannica]|nr:hypothetical protein BC828DRAFT_438585 [Blastocladiella britannica]
MTVKHDDDDDSYMYIASNKWKLPGVPVHAIIMIVVWAYLFPAAAVLARYFRSVRYAIWVHAGLQLVGTALVLASFTIILTNGTPGSFMQRLSGYPVLVITILQLLLGLYQLVIVAAEVQNLPISRATTRAAHGILGVVGIVLAFANIPQGNNIMAPVADGRGGHPLWLAYYFPLFAWIAIVSYLELRNRRSAAPWERVGAKDIGASSAALEFGVTSPAATGASDITLAANASTPLVGTPPHQQQQQQQQRPSDPRTTRASTLGGASSAAGPASTAMTHKSRHIEAQQRALETAAYLQSRAADAGVPVLSWASLDQAIVQNGQQWVVGPGGVIFDVKKFITAHPGGQAVLFDAMGTSVAIDYFNVANFDADLQRAFDPLPVAPQQHAGIGSMDRLTRMSAMTVGSGGSNASSSTATGWPTDKNALMQMSTNGGGSTLRLTAGEWQRVTKSRKTNVHSRQAVAKLQDMMVARIDPATVGRFDPHEWRRYALVRKATLSSPTTNGAAVTTWRLSFCLLYPHDTHAEEPAFFMPGHVVEVRVRVPKTAVAALKRAGLPVADIPQSGWITRYYTPLAGNLTMFDLAVKVLPGGLMSGILDSLSLDAHRQVQIRGPFGTPLVNPERPLPMFTGMWDHVVFLCAGSGIAPAWQFINWTFLPPHFPLVAATPFAASQVYELGVGEGHQVQVHESVGNGWIMATNLTTGARGMLPLHALAPWVTRIPRITVVAAEKDAASIMGRDVLELAADAYPAQVSVHYRVKAMPPLGSSAPAVSERVTVSQGRIDAPFVDHVMNRALAHEHKSGSSRLPGLSKSGPRTVVVLCGPQSFLDETYQWISEHVDDDAVVLLPANLYLALTATQVLVQPPNLVSKGFAVHLDPVTNIGTWFYQPADGAAGNGI